MRLITGDKLSADLKQQVLRAFVYRLTIENGYPKRNPCGAKVPAVSDEIWLKEHAFWVTNNNKLARNRKHAEPAFMVNMG